MGLRFAGVRRKTEFSPNHVGNDLEIIMLTGEVLQHEGNAVEWFTEGQTTPDCSRYDLVFSMAQGPEGNRSLMESVLHGGYIINSPESVMNCYRVNLVRQLLMNNIPFPKSEVVATGSKEDITSISFASHKRWVKRGDVHAVHREDVALVYSEREELNVLREFNRRGIQYAIVQEHLVGDTVKFYAVRESEFFHWYYLNGLLHTPFSQQHLIQLANASAEVLGLYVYGGDAIVGSDGSITIIDINDWPSFAPVRNEASRHIAQLLIQKAEEHVNQLQY